jgi:hypothetical protein
VIDVLRNNVLKENILATYYEYTKLTPTPTQYKPVANYYDILCDTQGMEEENDDDKTVITSNRAPNQECDSATVTTAELTEDELPPHENPQNLPS